MKINIGVNENVSLGIYNNHILKKITWYKI